MTALDLSTFAPEVSLVGATTIVGPHAAVSSVPVTGFSDVASVTLVTRVERVDNSNGELLTVTVQGSDDGNSWSTVAGPYTFAREGTQTLVVDEPADRLRVTWSAARGVREAVIGSVAARLSVVDTSSWAIREPFANAPITSSGRFPTAITLNPAGNTLYIGDDSGEVVPIDLATNTAGTEIVADAFTITSILCTPDGATLYVCTVTGIVVPIDTATATAGTPITVGNSPVDLAITPDGAKLYVSNGNDGTVTPITTATGIAGTPITVGTFPKGLAMRPDGLTMYVANFSDNTVQKINVANNTAGATVAVGAGPWGLQVSPDGAKLYVANASDDTIQVVDLVSFTADAPVSVGTAGQEPIGFAITADGSLLYVVLGQGGLVPVPTATLVPEPEMTTIGSANTSGWLALSADETTLYVANAPAPGIDYVLMRTISLDDVVGSLYHLATA